MIKFIPGLQLSQMYYEKIVKKILDNFFPKISYSAGLTDYGSDVLGFDTPISRDHQWWPRLSIFLSKKDYAKYGKKINEILSEQLPHEFHGYPTNFSGKVSDGIQRLQKSTSGKVNHLIRIHTVEKFFKEHLAWDSKKVISSQDRLLFPQQRLSILKKGKIFHDGLKLQVIKNKFQYYPQDIWLYMMACEWDKIWSEEAFIWRCGDIKDEVGGRIIAARLIQSIMNLCFLMEKEYAPYSKWFGTAFSKLKCAKKFLPIFEKALKSVDWKEREKYLAQAYELLAKQHNALKITKPLRSKVTDYYGRPYMVIFWHEFAQKIAEKIKNPEIKKLKLIGSIDQITYSNTILEKNEIIKKIEKIYE